MTNIKQFLYGSVIYLTTKEKIHLSWMSGTFIFLFMVFFQPFGVNNYRADEAITSELLIGLSIFSAVTTVMLLINELVIFKMVVKSLNLIKLILWYLWSVFWLTSGLFLAYNMIGNWHDWFLSSFFEFIMNIAVLSLLPFSAVVVYLRIKNLSLNLIDASTIRLKSNEGEQLISFTAENEKDRFSIKHKDLIIIQSEDNYVEIIFLNDNKLEKCLFRQTLKQMELQVESSDIMRIHRSYLINLQHVNSIKGNKNKMHIGLQHIDKELPVARNCISAVLKILDQ